MVKQQTKKPQLKYWIKIFLIGLIMLIMVTAFFVLFFGQRLQSNEEVIYEYTINQNISYEVEIYPTNLFEEEVLGMGGTYIANLVRMINFDFNFNYVGEGEGATLSYEVNARAIVTGLYNMPGESQGSRIWTREFELLERSLTAVINNQIDINEPISINYDYYNEILTNFRNEINLPIAANLEVVLEVATTAIVDNRAVEEIQTMRATIPLGQQAFRITLDYNEETSDIVLGARALIGSVQRNVFGSLLIVFALVISIILYKNFTLQKPLNNYQKLLKKIIKAYGDIIVEVQTEISKEGLEIVEVKHFNEMLDLEAQLKYPIIFWEREKNKLGEFTFVHQGVLYKYVLREDSKL